MYIWSKIKRLQAEGKSIRSIAKKLGISRNTVRKYLRREQPPKYNLHNKRGSQWDKYKNEIIYQMEKKNLILSVIYENLISMGAAGSRSSFYEYCKNNIIKKLSKNKLSMRFETEPGEQMQFDWAEYVIQYKDGLKEKVYVISVILGYSRYRINIASRDVTQNSLFQAMELAFECFGGVASTILVDNPKQLISNANKRNFKVNKEFEKFTAYYGFNIQACNVRSPQTKGKVENPYSYIKNHFIKNYEFNDFEDFSVKLVRFTDDVNNKYNEGIGAIPSEVFERVEKKALLNLPSESYFNVFENNIRQVSHTATIEYKNVTYSIPVLYANQMVKIMPVLGYKLEVYSLDGKKIAEHNIKQTKGGVIINEKHYKFLFEKKKQKRTGITKEFLNKFPDKANFLKGLKRDRKNHYITDIDEILRMCKYYSESDIRKGMELCNECNVYAGKLVIGYLHNNCTPVNTEPVIMNGSVNLIELYKDTDKRDLSYYDQIK